MDNQNDTNAIESTGNEQHLQLYNEDAPDSMKLYTLNFRTPQYGAEARARFKTLNDLFRTGSMGYMLLLLARYVQGNEDVQDELMTFINKEHRRNIEARQQRKAGAMS